MTSSIQFSGLASGLDTTSIISSLMDAERIPQTQLKNRLSTAQSQVSALQQLNTSLAALSTSAKSFATGSTWSQLAATSSSSAVTVTASSTALPATFSVSVLNRATSAQTTISASTFASATGTLTLQGNGTGAKAVAFEATDSLDTIAAKINASTKTTGMQAHLVQGAVGGPVVLIGSAATGTDSNFTVKDGSGTALVTTTDGVDAKVSLGAGLTVTSPSNTFTNLMPGIDVTLGADAGTTTTASISVAADGDSRATAMKAFISQLNDTLTLISGTTAYGTITDGQAAKGAGTLPGDPMLRGLADQLVNTVFPGGTSSMEPYGVSIDRYGKLTFSATKFTDAYEADPDAVQAAFTGTGGFADRVQEVADLASDPHTGSITQYIKSQNTQIDGYNDQIGAWDDRLAAKQASLQHIYTALETQLSKLQAQQSWLTSQIESLDGLSSSKS
jgi:flagellar hook-associated protein 2